MFRPGMFNNLHRWLVAGATQFNGLILQQGRMIGGVGLVTYRAVFPDGLMYERRWRPTGLGIGNDLQRDELRREDGRKHRRMALLAQLLLRLDQQLVMQGCMRPMAVEAFSVTDWSMDLFPSLEKRLMAGQAHGGVCLTAEHETPVRTMRIVARDAFFFRNRLVHIHASEIRLAHVAEIAEFGTIALEIEPVPLGIGVFMAGIAGRYGRGAV